MLKVGNNLIINADNFKGRDLYPEKEMIIITCGLKRNSTVTASSIGDDGFSFCVQRSILTLGNVEISPCEFNIHWLNKPDDLYPLLALVTMMLLCDVKPEVFDTIRF